MAESRPEAEKSGGNILTTYLREMRGEVRKVVWPTRQEATRWTGIVLLITAIMTVVLSFFDFLFSSGLTLLVDTILGIGG